MTRPRGWLLLVGVGAGLFGAASVHHWGELAALDGSPGPILAFLFDGIPALGIIYGGYTLSEADLRPSERLIVVRWCLAGCVLFAAVILATVLIRAFEGRAIPEPTFSLLVAAEAGAIAGLVAGFYNAQARANTRRAKRVSSALETVNSLIRHDLRNDLTTISGYADLVDSKVDGAGETAVITRKAEEALTRIENAGAISETLTDEPTVEMVDLVPMVEDLAASANQAFGGTVHTDLPETALVAANPALRSVVDNLVENALEHAEGTDSRVDVVVEREAETVRLAVRDDGPGIPAAERPTLFDYRDDGAGGGGLYLARTLVEEFDGDVWVEENAAGGATFVVELPAARRAAAVD